MLEKLSYLQNMTKINGWLGLCKVPRRCLLRHKSAVHRNTRRYRGRTNTPTGSAMKPDRTRLDAAR